MTPVPLFSLYPCQMQQLKLENSVTFKLHSNLKKNLLILYHALMQCFLSK